MYGSPDLVDTLLANELIDEFRLLFYPVILGSGKHLFRDGIETHHLRLVESRTSSSGVVLLTYQPESEAPTSRFVEDYPGPRSRCAPACRPRRGRILATVLFTDLVDSTGQAAARRSGVAPAPRPARPLAD